MRPETALVINKIIEQHFTNICASFNVPADREAYHNQLLDHIRALFPNRDPEFYRTIFLDFWANIIESVKSLDQSERWGENPYAEIAATVSMSPGQEPGAPLAAGTGAQERPSEAEAKKLAETQMVLEQIAALGDCLMAIAEEKELQSRKQTFVSLGVLIHQVVEIARDLQGKKET